MKITAGKFKGQNVESPKEARPTLSKVREAIFNVIQNSIEGSVFLDMFAGSGIMGLEALSRGAKGAVFIEKNPANFRVLEKNVNKITISNKLFKNDALKIINSFGEDYFDIIFLDPPYHTDLLDKAMKKIIRANILKNDGIIIAEHPKNKTIEAEGLALTKQKKYGDSVLSFLETI